MTALTAKDNNLVRFGGDPRRSGELVTDLGFEPVANPVDLLGRGVSGLREFFEVRADRFGINELYRVGERTAPPGTVGVYVAVLAAWGLRSSDRDRARRRIARALVERGTDSRVLIFLVPSEAERSAHTEAELVFPRPAQGGGPGHGTLTTVRALIDLSAPNRFHRDLFSELRALPGASLASISQQWQRVFSVERVAKVFYQEYQLVREALADALMPANPGHEVVRSLTVDECRAWATRQLGRVLFLWFLQSKRWLGGDGNQEGRADYLVDLWRRRDEAQGGFYRGMLLPLFFEGMARRNPGRPVRQLLEYTPYLNGGLFRRNALEDRIKAGGEVALPDELFDPTLDLSVLGLLSRYRFTTRESTPDDQSVDPDPELLGRVFENLYQGDERHDTGTFYTPREIVHFMCRQALDGYLRDTAGLDQDTIDRLRREVSDPEETDGPLNPDVERRLVEALESVRVCDPAVGSGAFLLGTMQEIVRLRQGILHSKGHEGQTGSESVAEWKRRAIQWSLYGVDINPEAVEICQLRLWLSLVLDMPSRRDIEPLPNLDFRIVAGDSLIDRAAGIPFTESLPQGVYQPPIEIWQRVKHEEEQIDKWRREFEATQENPERLKELRENIVRASQRVVRLHLNAELEAVREAADGVEKQARQPERTPREAQRLLRDASAKRERQALVEAAIAGLHPDAPYQKPFLWPVAFPEVFQHGGFDVVLANPPYVRQERLSPDDQQVYKDAFGDVYSGTADMLVFFYTRALQILRAGGRLAFITSNKFTRSDYGRGLRTLLQSHFAIAHVVDFGHIPVFEADVYPLVLIGTNRTPNAEHIFTYARLREPIRDAIVRRRARVNTESVREELEQIGTALEQNSHSVNQQTLGVDQWSFADSIGAELLRSLDGCATRISDVLGSETYWGIKTALNRAYVVTDVERASLIEGYPDAAAYVVPWLRGQDVDRWTPRSSMLYLLLLRNSADPESRQLQPWSSANSATEAETTFGRTLPTIYEHVRRLEKELRGRQDQGRHWWELRPCTYYSAFERSKVVWRDVSYLPQFAWDESGSLVGNTAFISASAPRWLVGYANSILFAWIASNRLMEGKDAYLRWLPSDIGRLPVPNFSADTRHRLDELVLSAIAAQGESERDQVEAAINHLVFVEAGVTPEQREMVQRWFVERVRTETLGSIARDAGDDE